MLEHALDAAVDVFWRQGYEGTTLRASSRAAVVFALAAALGWLLG